ncbi:hypothetical protein A2U01_0070474, partial [Trifolium medium]|nr:hypothetical protein [Trifolium medium]
MPPKKVTLPAFKEMEARVDVLESDLTEMRTILVDVQNSVKTNHANLMAMLEKCFGKSMVVDDGSASVSVKGSPAKSSITEKIVQQ